MGFTLLPVWAVADLGILDPGRLQVTSIFSITNGDDARPSNHLMTGLWHRNDVSFHLENCCFFRQISFPSLVYAANLIMTFLSTAGERAKILTAVNGTSRHAQNPYFIGAREYTWQRETLFASLGIILQSKLFKILLRFSIKLGVKLQRPSKWAAVRHCRAAFLSI